MFTKKWLPSPFFTSRGNYPLDMIIIHHIGSKEGKFYSISGTLTWFTNKEVHKNKNTGKIENKVSAHYVIPRENHEGNDLYHLVENLNIAYHAGISQWTVNDKLRKYINRYSIGIELEGDGNLIDYTDFQYEILVWLVKDLTNKHNIDEANIVGHEDIAPGRKVDPGKYFDWKKLRSKINPSVIISLNQSPTNPIKITKAEVPIRDSNTTEEVSPIKVIKDEEFFMGDGSTTDGGLARIFKSIFEIILKIFRIK